MSIKMIYDNLNKVLEETKPTSLSIKEYRWKILSGKLFLSKDQENRVLKIVSPLAEYGKSLAKKNNTPEGDFSLNLINGGLNLSTTNCNCSTTSNKSSKNQLVLEPNKATSSNIDGPEVPPGDDTDPIIEGSLTNSEIIQCAAEAIGLDALYALGTSAATVWTVAAIKTVLRTALPKFLGPIGVGIALGYFGYCLYTHGAVTFEPEPTEPYPTDSIPLAYIDTISVPFTRRA